MTTTATHDALSEAKEQLLDAIDDVYNAVGIRLEGHDHARRTIAAAERDFRAATVRFGQTVASAARDMGEPMVKLVIPGFPANRKHLDLLDAAAEVERLARRADAGREMRNR